MWPVRRDHGGMAKAVGRDDPPKNVDLTRARCALRSPSGSGRELSRQELADAVNAYLWDTFRTRDVVDATYVGHLEQGRHRWPKARRREAFRHVLGVATDAELGFFIMRGLSRSTAFWEQPCSPNRGHGGVHRPGALAGSALSSDAETGQQVTSTPFEDATSEEKSVVEGVNSRRRALLCGIATVAAASGLFGGHVQSRARRVGVTDVARLNALTTLYRSMDYEFGGGMLVTDVGRFAESASALLDLSYSDAVAPTLLTAIASASQLAGWTAFDAGRHSDAQRHFLSAERAAVGAGDTLLAARVRYCQARQLQHLRHNRDALDTLRLARDQLGAATPAVSAMIYGAEAASRAAIGDRDGALTALGNANDAFARLKAGHEPDWMSFFDHGEVLAQHGRVYRDLARTDRRHGPAAVRWVTEAINAFGPQNVRSTILNEVGLCSALFLADEPEHAVAVGRRLHQHATTVKSQRIADRMANLRRDLGRHSSRPDVNEFARGLPVLRAA
jgi:hypothetical protein